MSSLTKKDYIKILEYYDLPIPKKQTQMKTKAENVLANKLCRCIKKVGTIRDEKKGIGVCTRSIFKKKGLVRGSFKCKKSIKKVNIQKQKKNKTKKKRIKSNNK